MTQIKVCGIDIDVDIMDELEMFTWERPRWSTEKLIAASPFRYDNNPSFFINLDGPYAGVWGDSGAFEEDYESGNLPKLLAFLRDETYEEACDYLLETYGGEVVEGDSVKIPPITLRVPTRRITLDEKTLTPYAFRHGYLTNRGINERTQRFMGVGYSKESAAITLPWRHPDGLLANIKYRKVQGKTFWYISGASPVRQLVYGIDKVYKHGFKRVVVCEAEIDAMSWYSGGKLPAVALGGTSVTKAQLDMIRKSPIETIVLAMDNDPAGLNMQRKLVEGLRGQVAIERIKIPADYKDANDALVAGVDLSELRANDFDYLFDRHVQE